MHLEAIHSLYDYHYWANARILGEAEQLDAAQFAAGAAVPHGGLRAVLVHMLNADRIWRAFWQGEQRPTPLAPEEFSTAQELAARCRADEAEMRAYLATLDDAALDSNRSLAPRLERSLPLWQILVHVANHGTQHRSEAATLLTAAGHSPGDLDFLIFALERAAAGTTM